MTQVRDRRAHSSHWTALQCDISTPLTRWFLVMVESLGDILADAVDEGTGCVLCPYAINAAESKNRIGGRITNYLPCTLGFIEGGIELTMVKNKAVLAAHPECAEILEGVNVLSGGRESMHMTINQVIVDRPACVCLCM